MAIKRKPNAERWICCTHDPAILPAGEKAINDYSIDRDLEKLGVDTELGVLIETGETVSLYKVLPLRSESFHLIEGGVAAYKEIFRTHVVNVKHTDGVKVDWKNNKSYIRDEAMDNVDLETLSEVAGVIVNLGSGRTGEDRAFFLAGTSQLQRSRSRQLSANRARIDPASVTQRVLNSEGPSQEKIS